MARLTRNEIGAIATMTGLGAAATGAVVYLASTAPADSVRPRVTTQTAPPAARPHHQGLPFALDLRVVAVIAALLALLALWAWWQDRHRCQTCGYCPAWCRCHELADHR
jgi:hypothetical protein